MYQVTNLNISDKFDKESTETYLSFFNLFLEISQILYVRTASRIQIGKKWDLETCRKTWKIKDINQFIFLTFSTGFLIPIIFPIFILIVLIYVK